MVQEREDYDSTEVDDKDLERFHEEAAAHAKWKDSAEDTPIYKKVSAIFVND